MRVVQLTPRPPVDGLAALAFPGLSRLDWLAHGVSPPADLAGQPVDLRWRDDGVATVAARTRMLAAIGMPSAALAVPVQTHSAHVARVTRDTLSQPGALDQTDGVFTTTPGLGLMVLGADCGNVLVADTQRRAFGVVHAGWRGLAGGIVTRLVLAMRDQLGTDPAGCQAGVGPCAGGQAYEVGPEVVQALAGQPGLDQGVLPGPTPGKWRLDVAQLCAAQLLAAGLPDDAIELANVCTITDPDRWPSFRRDGASSARLSLVGCVRR